MIADVRNKVLERTRARALELAEGKGDEEAAWAIRNAVTVEQAWTDMVFYINLRGVRITWCGGHFYRFYDGNVNGRDGKQSTIAGLIRLLMEPRSPYR